MPIPSCYAGSILRVDLSSARVERDDMADYVGYVGGRALGAKLYWDEVKPDLAAFDAGNALIFVTGPCTGIPGTASARWQVYAKSPVTDRQGFTYSNIGGTWGVALKAAGYDALVLRGQADHLSYLLLDDAGAKLVDAAHLAGFGAIQTRQALKAELGDDVSVVSIGPAGENKVAIATILAEKDASGASGLGAVMGSKRLKAVVVRKGYHHPAPTHPDRLKAVIKQVRHLLGSDTKSTPPVTFDDPMRKDYCWGCPGPCMRFEYRGANGRRGKFMCQASAFYIQRAQQYYKGDGNEVAFETSDLCNEYGIDTMNVEIMTAWLGRCRRSGILTDDDTGIPLSAMGSREFIATLLRKIASREGIGDALAHGIVRGAEIIGRGAVEQIGDLVHKAEGTALYGPRLYIANGIVYMMEPRQALSQLHEISFLVDAFVEHVNQKPGAFVDGDVVRAIAQRFWGSDAAADFTTYAGKALAAKMIQDRSYAKECTILCDLMFPVLFSRHTPDHVGDPTLESQVFSAVTGWEVDEQALNRLGERALLLQRAVMVREGHRGREDDRLPEFCFDTPLKVHSVNPQMLIPGPNGQPVCGQGSKVDRAAFDQMKDEYYRLRGWDVATGLPAALPVPDARFSVLG